MFSGRKLFSFVNVPTYLYKIMEGMDEKELSLDAIVGVSVEFVRAS